MKSKYLFVFSGLILAACSAEDTRYKDLRALERPPIVVSPRQPGEARFDDDGALDREPKKKGLGEVVYLTESNPPQIMIRQSLDQSWDALGRALKQSDIDVIDHERNKGLYYVAYKVGGFFSRLMSGSVATHKDANYTLTLEQDGDEVVVSASAVHTESTASSQDGYNETRPDLSGELLKNLYDTLHDDLKAD